MVVEGSVYQRITTRQALAVDRGRPRAAPGPTASVSGCLVNTRTSHRVPSPRSVLMCSSGSHVIVLRHRETGAVSFEPFRCNSWRCERCRRFKGAQDFVRVRDGMLRLGPEWVYSVLTFDPSQYRDQWDAFRAGCRNFQKLNQRLTRAFGKIAYVQTWEQHKTGWPHVNVAIHNSEIFSRCAGAGWRSWRQWLIPHAIACGFGRVVHVHPLYEGGTLSLAGYMTKLSRELTGSATKDQTPVDAPLGFHRLRTSRGLLEPIYRPGKHDGVLIPVKALGTVDLSPEGWLKRNKSIVGQSGRGKRGF